MTIAKTITSAGLSLSFTSFVIAARSRIKACGRTLKAFAQHPFSPRVCQSHCGKNVPLTTLVDGSVPGQAQKCARILIPILGVEAGTHCTKLNTDCRCRFQQKVNKSCRSQ